MNKVPVRTLMSFSPRELRDGLKTNLEVIFDDGVSRELTSKEIILNRYVWSLTELFPNLPILNSFDITNYYVNGSYVSSTINKAFENILMYIVDTILEPNTSRKELAMIWKGMQDIFNTVYNEIVFENLDYITSLDINMFLDIQLDPRLIEAMRKVSAAPIDNSTSVVMAIENCYRTLHNVINDEKYHGNKIVNGYNSGTMRNSQVRQVLASRGCITNLAEEIYKKPIASSFVSGMYSIDEMAMESQTGAKALITASGAISKSEYNARKLQLVAARVERVVDGDCGQKDYLDWRVEADSNNGGERVKGHLPNLIGKYYLNEETGQEERITKNHTHLIGKVIKLRVAYKCQWKDKRCICSKCLGRLAYNIPEHTHLGHYASTTITQKMTQTLLSLKHEITSAAALPIDINQQAKNDLEVKDNDNTHVYIRRRLTRLKPDGSRETIFDNKRDYSLTLKVPSQWARGIADISPTTDVKRFSPASVSSLKQMSLVKILKDGGIVTEVPLEIKKGRRFASFTTEFLLHIQKYQYTIDNDENLLIPLDDWNFSLPFVIVPDVEFSYFTFSDTVFKLFGSSGTGSGRKGNDEDEETGGNVVGTNTQAGLLHRLYTEVNSKLDVNIALFEVIVAAFSVRDFEAGDYSLAHGADTATTRNIKTILINGSMGGAYAYQEHMATIMNPNSFDRNNNLNHIMDIFITPEEAIEDYKNNPIVL